MADVVVTVPKLVGLEAWIAEGDLPGEPWSGNDSYFWVGRRFPQIVPGERMYIVYNEKVRGYAPLVRLHRSSDRRVALVRRDGAVAVTILDRVPGFRGFRYRWWAKQAERPFPDWMKP